MSWDDDSPSQVNPLNWSGAPIATPIRRTPSRFAPVLVDLFSGCGGLSHGFAAEGFEPVLAVDHHPPALESFRLNHPDAGSILGDASIVSSPMLLETLSGLQVDVVVGGVPCQGFSRSNRKRTDADPRNLLFRQFVRMVDAIRPRAFVLENVGGLRSAGGGAFARELETELSSLGYAVDSRVIDAADFGVPQHRRRLLFVGVRGAGFIWPEPTHGPGRDLPWVTVGDALGDLPALEAGESATLYDRGPETDYQRLMRAASTGLDHHEAPSHPAKTLERMAKTAPGAPLYGSFQQRVRLHPDLPSPTQVAGGIRPQPQHAHPWSARGLTVRELCRLQSFPDDYQISVLGGVTQQRLQVGNAVPPLLAAAVARQLRLSLLASLRDK